MAERRLGLSAGAGKGGEKERVFKEETGGSTHGPAQTGTAAAMPCARCHVHRAVHSAPISELSKSCSS